MPRVRRKQDETEEEYQARREEAGLPPIPAGGETDRAPKQRGSNKLIPRAAIESAVGLLNGIIGMVSPADALTMGKHEPTALSFNLEDEFGMLVDALTEQQKEHERFRKYLARFCMFSGGANLIGVVGLILYKRYMMRTPAAREAAERMAREAEGGPPTDGFPQAVHVRPNGLLPVEPERPEWSTADGVGL